MARKVAKHDDDIMMTNAQWAFYISASIFDTEQSNLEIMAKISRWRWPSVP